MCICNEHKTSSWYTTAGGEGGKFYLIDTVETNTAEQNGASVQTNTNTHTNKKKKSQRSIPPTLLLTVPSQCFTGDSQVRLETALFTHSF